MKLIYTHENIMVLHSAKNILELNGIEAFVKSEDIIPSGARLGIGNIFLELWIMHDGDYDKARAIIEKQIENPEPKESWFCPKCAEQNDGSFDVCWNCQSASSLRA